MRPYGMRPYGQRGAAFKLQPKTCFGLASGPRSHRSSFYDERPGIRAEPLTFGMLSCCSDRRPTGQPTEPGLLRWARNWRKVGVYQHPLAALLHVDAGRFGDRRLAFAIGSCADPGEIVGEDGGVAINLHPRILHV